jgi:bifunctional non-homologous end joining protein LigD
MITPMVPRLITIPFDRDDWLFEIKWDGFRAITERDETGVKLYSRNHRDLTKRFPPITQAVAALKHNVILDGEIVALDDRGHARFEWLVKRGRQHGILRYFVFDLLYRDTNDLQNEPLAQRKQHLQQLLAGHERLQYVEHITTHGTAIFEAAVKLGMEGIVAKDPNSPYIQGPRDTWHWQKIKNKEYQRQGKIEFRKH